SLIRPAASIPPDQEDPVTTARAQELGGSPVRHPLDRVGSPVTCQYRERGIVRSAGEYIESIDVPVALVDVAELDQGFVSEPIQDCPTPESPVPYQVADDAGSIEVV